MTRKIISDAVNNISTEYIEKAADYTVAKKARKPVWLKWAAMAACLCLVVVGAYVMQNPVPGTGDNLDEREEIKRLAVYPATESFENVQNAMLYSLTEDEAYAVDNLGDYLPTQLPENFSFRSAGLYETTMNNGTKYYMLRVVYTDYNSRTSATSQDENNELAIEPNDFGNEFTVFVMSYKPNTEKRVYTVDTINEAVLQEIDGQTFHLSFEDIYVGISPYELSANDIMTIIGSINNNQ